MSARRARLVRLVLLAGVSCAPKPVAEGRTTAPEPPGDLDAFCNALMVWAQDAQCVGAREAAPPAAPPIAGDLSVLNVRGAAWHVTYELRPNDIASCTLSYNPRCTVRESTGVGAGDCTASPIACAPGYACRMRTGDCVKLCYVGDSASCPDAGRCEQFPSPTAVADVTYGTCK